MAAASLHSPKWNPLIQQCPKQKRSFFFNQTVSTRFHRVSGFQTIKCSDASKKKTTANRTDMDVAFSFKPFGGGPPLIFKPPSHSTQPVFLAHPFNPSWFSLAANRSPKNPAWKDRKPLEGILDALIKTLKSWQKPATSAILLGVLLTFDPHSAFAASAGRMGGGSFSSSSSSSGSSWSSSSSGSSSSWSYWSSSRPWSSSSRSYWSSSDDESYSYSRSRTSSPGFSNSVPYYDPSPFHWYQVGGGFLVGPPWRYSMTSNPGFSYSLPCYAPDPSPFQKGEGSSFLESNFDDVIAVFINLMLLITGITAVLLVFNSSTSSRSTPSCRSQDGATQKSSVLKLQVALLGSARSLQSDLDRIANSADTSTTKETTVALLRHPNYWISAYLSTDVKCSMEDVENLFNRLSIEERGKCDEETLVNVNNMKKKSTSSLRSKGFSNEYIVVTVVVAAEGVLELPVINGSSDLKEALQTLGSVSSSRTLAVEVLWTPHLENDVLSEEELLQDYPLLRPLEG